MRAARRSRAAAALLAAGALAAPAGARAAPPPRLSATASILVEASTGRVLTARRPDAERPIASTTKMMTVLLALEREPLRRVLVVPPYAIGPAESRVGLVTGERIRVADLVRAALLPSANDAAYALAVRAAGSRDAFVGLMNARARRLALAHTHFSTPVGLDAPGNFSSARDLARLARVLRHEPFARRTMDEGRAVLRSGARQRVVLNRNRLVRAVPWMNGVKTGHTLGAGYVLVGSARRGGLGLVSVVLGTPSEAARDADTLALMRWGFATFRRARPVRRGQELARLGVSDGPEHIALLARRGIRRLLRRADRVHIRVHAPRELLGPLPRGAIVGSATVGAGGRVLGRVDLLTARAVPGHSGLARAVRFLGPPGMVVLVVALVLAAFAIRRRRRPRSERMRTA